MSALYAHTHTMHTHNIALRYWQIKAVSPLEVVIFDQAEWQAGLRAETTSGSHETGVGGERVDLLSCSTSYSVNRTPREATKKSSCRLRLEVELLWPSCVCHLLGVFLFCVCHNGTHTPDVVITIPEGGNVRRGRD